MGIFAGEAGGTASGCSEAVAASFKNMRMIVTAGWSIYPLGYLFGYLLGSVDETFLNVFSTLPISSTRLLSCLRAGPAPKLNLKARRMFCWLRVEQRARDWLGTRLSSWRPCLLQFSKAT